MAAADRAAVEAHRRQLPPDAPYRRRLFGGRLRGRPARRPLYAQDPTPVRLDRIWHGAVGGLGRVAGVPHLDQPMPDADALVADEDASVPAALRPGDLDRKSVV